MKILFIYPQPPFKEGKERLFNQGIAYLSAVLKKNNHNASLITIYSSEDVSDIIDSKINEFKPDLIGISSTTDQIDLSKKIISYIHSKFKIPIVLGGVHPTIAPLECIGIRGTLGICIGEGEYAFLELVNALEKKQDYLRIQNFWFKKGKRIIKNPVRNLIQNLDELPFPDREIFDYEDLLENSHYGIEFMGSRGCPYQCTYCINHTLQKIYKNKGNFVRYRNVDNFIKEIKEVTSKYKNYKFLTFHDDTFTLNKSWLKEFCEKYSKEINIPFRCNIRADLVDKEIIELLKKANCSQVWIGVESGNEKLRNKVLKKRLTNESIIKTFKLAKEAGIKTMAFNMVGLPYETEPQIKETLEFSKQIDTDLKAVNVFRPYPGTELYKLCKKKGWISKRKVKGYYEDSILDQPSISKEKVNYYKELFYPYVSNSKYLKIIKPLIKLRFGKSSLYSKLKKAKNKLNK
ncbi:B12-binding domain-containing radical SAM protein [Candidatus Woesearchaeota archaeon]|nr:B12-binding domain-containing radical SAM protein [Candidatus Woesearchaeota archaeon]